MKVEDAGSSLPVGSSGMTSKNKYALMLYVLNYAKFPLENPPVMKRL